MLAGNQVGGWVVGREVWAGVQDASSLAWAAAWVLGACWEGGTPVEDAAGTQEMQLEVVWRVALVVVGLGVVVGWGYPLSS